ncbi:MAG: AraC family transcriptional regulator [Hyphomicrobiales bacterium]
MDLSQLGIRFFHADDSEYGTAWHGVRFADDYHRLYHIVRGSAHVTYDGIECELLEGCSYLFPPTASFRYRCPDNLRLQNVCFKMTMLGGVDILALRPWHFEISRSDPASMKMNMTQIHDGLNQPGFADRIDMHGRLLQLLAPHFDIHETIADRKRRYNVERLASALRHIATNLRSGVHVSDLPTIAGMSRSHFIRTFTAALGLSPQTYIRRQRVELIKIDLQGTSKSLAVLADESGYSSASHMTREFKKITGFTPKEYRLIEQPFS